MRFYEQAIQAAHARGFVHVEAIARELAAKLYQERGFAEFARAYLQEARACYILWGAESKARQLDEQHPELTVPRARVSTTFIGRAAELDLLSVLKASQTISGEIVRDELARTLIRVVLEQGGAQRGCLILAHRGRLAIEAMAELDASGVRVELRPAVTTESALPMTLVEHAADTGERVIYDDAERRFAGDPYLLRCRPRSALCLPVRLKAQVVGYLYLENALVAGAFPPNRLTVAELLASQAAISLENARLLTEAFEARRGAEAAQERAAFLAEAGALLSESLDWEQVLSRLSQRVVRSLADWCELDLIEEGQIHRRAGAHANPAKDPLLQELARRYPPNWNSAHPQLETLRSGTPLLLTVISDDYVERHTVDAAHAKLVRELGFSSGLIVPLKARERILGALTLISARPERPYGATDIALAEELARRAAMAIDNSLLYREARAAIRLREEFLSVASHELRTPLTSLLMNVQWLNEKCWQGAAVVTEAMSRSLQRITRQARRLNRQVDDLLDVVHIQAGRLELCAVDVDLRALVEEVLSDVELGLKRAGCEVKLHAPEAVCGRWDRSRLEQVVSNLLSNAIKFGAGRPIEITVRKQERAALLVVTDHGIGIDPAQQERIFDRFTRAVSASHYGGIGLGLYICREIVAAHQGTIRIESRINEGASFIVELPIADRPEIKRAQC
jgi:signal transduction histidine kinase